MPLVTLIGENLAKTGKELVFYGVNMGCKACRLKSACMNLEEGRRYVIKNVRDNRHDCKVHEGGVKAVEVEKVAIATTLSKKNTIKGAVISFATINCRNLGCEFYKKCHPVGLKDGTMRKIVSVGGDVNCPEGYNLREIHLL